MSETSDERIVSKSTLKRREQIIKDPSIMYAKYEEFYDYEDDYEDEEEAYDAAEDYWNDHH